MFTLSFYPTFIFEWHWLLFVICLGDFTDKINRNDNHCIMYTVTGTFIAERVLIFTCHIIDVCVTFSSHLCVWTFTSWKITKSGAAVGDIMLTRKLVCTCPFYVCTPLATCNKSTTINALGNRYRQRNIKPHVTFSSQCL